MKKLLRSALLAAMTALPVVAAHAIEFRSVGEPSILYDTPSDQGKRMFIIAPDTPVEVVVELDAWTKIRAPGGAITWIERRALTPKRTLLVTTDSAIVRTAPQAGAPAAFEAARDVVLELVTPPAAGWAEVRHRDGSTGFVRITEVWGL